MSNLDPPTTTTTTTTIRHDPYIELAESITKSDPEEAINVLDECPVNDPPTDDDAYVHAEVVRLLMKQKAYKVRQLSTSTSFLKTILSKLLSSTPPHTRHETYAT